jgi:cell division protein FtsN
MLRIIVAGIAAVALGTLGGLMLNRATPQKDTTVSELQSATIASATVVTTPRPADPAPKRAADPAPAPKPIAEPAPAPKARSAPASLPIPADLLKEKPDIRFDGDRVSIRLGKYKIEF